MLQRMWSIRPGLQSIIPLLLDKTKISFQDKNVSVCKWASTSVCFWLTKKGSLMVVAEWSYCDLNWKDLSLGSTGPSLLCSAEKYKRIHIGYFYTFKFSIYELVEDSHFPNLIPSKCNTEPFFILLFYYKQNLYISCWTSARWPFPLLKLLPRWEQIMRTGCSISSAT